MRKDVKIKSLMSYDMGLVVGELIVYRFLPTLNLDCIQGRNVVDVSDEDLVEFNVLDKKYSDLIRESGYKSNDENTKVFEALRSFRHSMAKKYLKDELVCMFFRLHPNNIEDFKRGISDSLWDSDMSWYSCDLDKIDVEHIEYFKNFEKTKITLKLEINY